MRRGPFFPSAVAIFAWAALECEISKKRAHVAAAELGPDRVQVDLPIGDEANHDSPGVARLPVHCKSTAKLDTVACNSNKQQAVSTAIQRRMSRWQALQRRKGNVACWIPRKENAAGADLPTRRGPVHSSNPSVVELASQQPEPKKKAEAQAQAQALGAGCFGERRAARSRGCGSRWKTKTRAKEGPTAAAKPCAAGGVPTLACRLGTKRQQKIRRVRAAKAMHGLDFTLSRLISSRLRLVGGGGGLPRFGVPLPTSNTACLFAPSLTLTLSCSLPRPIYSLPTECPSSAAPLLARGGHPTRSRPSELTHQPSSPNKDPRFRQSHPYRNTPLEHLQRSSPILASTTHATRRAPASPRRY